MVSSPTKILQALDGAHHMHPFTHAADLARKGARIITHGKGVWLTDGEGAQIIDGMSGLWCVNIGYGREELAQVAAEQMAQLPYYNTFFQTTHLPVIRLSQKLAQIAPATLNHVFYANSGSEANDTNIRLVRHYWAMKGAPEKNIIIARHNAYHGSTMGSGSLGGMAAMHAQGGLPIAHIHHIVQPDWWSEGGDMSPEEFALYAANALENAIQSLGEKRVAAFIAEPIQGAGGVIIPPDGYWEAIQAICKKYEILLIADEVICGFGRLGEWFGAQAMAIQPDIMTIAKGLSSGYIPIGGSLVSDEIATTIGEDSFNHGYTYSGHPVACAVALENLRIIDSENIIAHVRDVAAPYLQKKWFALQDHPLVGEAKMMGMMGSIALTDNKKSRASFQAKAEEVGYICREICFQNDLIMRHVGARMVIAPPLVITLSEIDTLMERVGRSLDQTYMQLKKDRLI